MRKVSIVRRGVQLRATSAAVCMSIAGAAAIAQTPIESVSVFTDHYVYAGRWFDDLDRLEDAVVAAHPLGVRLDACGAGTARAQGAAAHRFRNLYLDLRISAIDDRTCATASAPRAMPVSQRFGLRPYGINDESVDRWWNTISMP